MNPIRFPAAGGVFVLAGLLVSLPCRAGEVPRVRNGGFENVQEFSRDWLAGFEGVSFPEGTRTCRGISNVAHSGLRSAVIRVREGSPASFHTLAQDVPGVRPGQSYRLSFWMRIENVRGGVGAYGAVGGVDPETGARSFANETERLTGTRDWTRVSRLLFVPEGVDTLRILLLLHGTGTAWFDDVELTLLRTQRSLDADRVPVHVTDEVVCDSFLGFGYEDDSFFFTEENLGRGIDEDDLALRKRRMDEMDGDTIATLFWWEAISPGTRDVSRITYDTELMRAFYRLLDYHQDAGNTVIVSDVFWGWRPEQIPYSVDHLGEGVRAYVDLFDHLVHEKGYDCIRIASISGEVDMRWVSEFGGTLESYAEAVRRFRRGLDERGLGDLLIVGDKVSGTVWFQEAVRLAGDAFGIFAVHEYPHLTQSPIVHLRLREALEAVREASGADGRSRPVYCWEIGYVAVGHRDTRHTAIRRFDYGLLCARTVLGILNEGLAGGSVWCLHSMYYPGAAEPMDFGFWEFKDTDWAIRPFYYGYGMVTRFTDPGMKTLRVERPRGFFDFDAAAMENPDGSRVVFLLNQSGRDTVVDLSGMPAGPCAIYEYAQDRIPAPDDPMYGRIDALRTGRTWRPGLPVPLRARSFLLLVPEETSLRPPDPAAPRPAAAGCDPS